MIDVSENGKGRNQYFRVGDGIILLRIMPSSNKLIIYDSSNDRVDLNVLVRPSSEFRFFARIREATVLITEDYYRKKVDMKRSSSNPSLSTS